MPGQLFEHGFVGAVAVPYKRTEVVGALELARQAEVRVEKRYYSRARRPYVAHDAYNAVAVYHTKLGLDAVVAALVDGDVVVGVGNAVVNHVGDNKLEVWHARVYGHGVLVSLLCHQVDALLQAHNLGLKFGIAAVEVVVDVVEVEIRGHIVGTLVGCRCKASGRGQVEVLAVGVVTKKQHAAYHHQEGEDKPLAVTDKKGDKFVHVPAPSLLPNQE